MSISRVFTILIILLIISGAMIFFWQVRGGSNKQADDTTPNKPVSNSVTDRPEIVSTNPHPLDGAVIASDQQIEIVFNRGLENEGELKIRIEPKVNYKITLSQDRKTAKIIPQEPFELGVGYTMFITGDTKFEGLGPWGEEKIFHFQTIKYRGL